MKILYYEIWKPPPVGLFFNADAENHIPTIYLSLSQWVPPPEISYLTINHKHSIEPNGTKTQKTQTVNAC